jgi:hypothetical protein
MLGLIIYHERVGGGGARIAIEVLAVLAARWGIVRLANSVVAELSRLARLPEPSAGTAGSLAGMAVSLSPPLVATEPPAGLAAPVGPAAIGSATIGSAARSGPFAVPPADPAA